MNAVATITPHLAAIECPDVLRALPGWLLWRFEQHEGEPKPRKVPYYASGARRHGVQGRPEDRQQLVTFDAARAAAARRGFDGLGFCFMPDFNIVGLDFDNCVAAGGVHPDIERLAAGTYAEFSPSGSGAHVYFRGESLGNRKDAKGVPFGVEVFSTKGFLTFTGMPLLVVEMTDSANTVADVTPEVLALCEARFGRAEAADAGTSTTEPLGLTAQQLQDALDVLDPSMGHDNWLRMGMALHHETRGEGFDLWDEWSSAGVQYPGRDALLQRWDSFGRGNQRPTTVHYLVRLANEHGAHIDIAATAADDFQVLPVEATPDKPNRFEVVPAHQFAGGKSPGWIVKGVVPQADLVVMFGESGSGKSFVALDLGAAIARGIPWRGLRTKKRRVVYIAAEGAGGFRNRLKAYASKHGIALADLDIGVVHVAPNFLQHQDAIELCKAILAAGGADVVIVDTWAQVTPGANENAADDMGKALASCRGINRATGALVLLIHHSGKDASKGARGWSGLKAAADAELEVLRTPLGRAIRVSKQKDGEDGLGWGFELDQVPVGVDEDNEVVTSCVVRETDMPAIQQVGATSAELGELGRRIVAVVDEFALAQTAGIEVEAVAAAVAERMPAPPIGGRDTRKQRVKARLAALIAAEKVPYFIEDGCLSIA